MTGGDGARRTRTPSIARIPYGISLSGQRSDHGGDRRTARGPTCEASARLYHRESKGVRMDTLDEALRARIDELAGSGEGRQPILSTTGTQVAIAELIARNDRLERAVGELSLEIEALAASQRGGTAAHRRRVRPLAGVGQRAGRGRHRVGRPAPHRDARADLVARPAASLRAVGAVRVAPDRGPGSSGSGRHAVRHGRLDNRGTPGGDRPDRILGGSGTVREGLGGPPHLGGVRTSG